ncbi:carotenoid biosynthesis protein [Cyclobacterium jeungdonense]|uniref:Carotenoid biosynthesis protein n=1 Tax=Cyclobacterium jeungdonense TaxID=708087 RepID=A0ABT8C4V8_9BACT|nr:carotenoid biosynthesis protein [Cyclobacterium jeungdonense]MDN3687805.1 carotenoid biosynthesis protein [Cyclobacterium jeungdonense]
MNGKNHLELSGFIERNKLAIAKTVVLILHVVGIAGLFWETSRPIFQLVTPFHLLLVTSILLYFHKGYNRWFFIFALSAFGIGMITEIIGVNTGLIFGDYFYGPVLGPKLMGVPLLIGVNWFLMVYLTGGVVYRMIRNNLVAAAAGAALMVVMDVNLEPVAMALNFWQWDTQTIPLSNYFSWFLIAFTIQLIYRKSPFNKENKLNFFLFINFLLFFFVLAIIL